MGSGDLLLVRTRSFAGRTVRVFGQSWYNHVAVVLRESPADVLAAYGVDPAPLHVLECDVPRARLVPLDEWRRKFRGAICTWRKVLPRSGTLSVRGAPGDAWGTTVVRLADCKYPTMLQTVWRRVGWFPPGDCANCVDVACDVLRAVGALDEGPQTTRIWTPDSLSGDRWRDRRVWREIALPLGGQHDARQEAVQCQGDAPGEGGAAHGRCMAPPRDGTQCDGDDAEQVHPRAAGCDAPANQGECEEGNTGLAEGDAAGMGHDAAALVVPPHGVVQGAGQEQRQPEEEGDHPMTTRLRVRRRAHAAGPAQGPGSHF